MGYQLLPTLLGMVIGSATAYFFGFLDVKVATGLFAGAITFALALWFGDPQ